MADKWRIYITPDVMTITDLQTTDPITGASKILFSSDYRYLHYDPSGAIKFPVNETMSGMNGNLTWQFNGSQVVIPNTFFGSSLPVSFDTYIAYFTVLNDLTTNSTFSTVQVANVELPGIVSGPDPSSGAGSDGSYGGEGGIGDSSGADSSDGDGADSDGSDGEGDGDGAGDGGDAGEGGGDAGEGG